ncbi:hypothetical protein H634G_01920 [Metarhizium anisopliae BRIP 53293]|uniref:Uncharacterized protein n=1 Tax=Metarhizium anisopliae BRIP 53293 TaxID=1291518 RepID=A0A0D9P9F6_METAN|nr:hypothetical protein H634G_01920 [Metarhizium anisopliae BRIP 53293]KJK93417.1 hypothetical protein H633G_02618 [Metarhizium anisopliae BRIP 53284]
MLALAILLSAAAGVNAILDGHVRGVQISETEYICADNCVHAGIYFAQLGHLCPVKEVVRREQGGELDEFPYDCRGAKKPDTVVFAPLQGKEKPENCDVFLGNATDVNSACVANRIVGGGTKILQLSEVAA